MEAYFFLFTVSVAAGLRVLSSETSTLPALARPRLVISGRAGRDPTEPCKSRDGQLPVLAGTEARPLKIALQ